MKYKTHRFAPLFPAVLWSIIGLPANAQSTTAPSLYPTELVRFAPYEHNPVFTAEGPEHWDVKIRERGWILRVGPVWHLWYTGYDGVRDDIKMLGHATSSDGLHWTRDPANPIYREHWVEDMMVLCHAGQYYMFAEGRDDQAHWLTSPDGLKWTRQGILDIRTADGKPMSPGPFGTPIVWHEKDGWFLMFERGDQAVWLASSKDLKTWTLVQDDPVLKPGPDAYDKLMIAVDQVIRYGGRYYAYYHGSGDPQPPRTWTTNIATSTDRIHWTKYAGNPIVPGDRSSALVVPEDEAVSGKDSKDAKSSDDFDFAVPTRFRLYTMHDKVDAFLPAGK